MEDSGRGYRRVVPSPLPLQVVEIDAIRTLAAAGHVVARCRRRGHRRQHRRGRVVRGCRRVIDKDHAAAAVAAALGAQDLYLLTGVDAVLLDFGTPTQRPAHLLTADEAAPTWPTASSRPGAWARR